MALDYFGQTVNMAARLQAAAGAGELVVVAAAVERACQGGWLPQAAQAELFERELRGVGVVQLARLRLDSQVHT